MAAALLCGALPAAGQDQTTSALRTGIQLASELQQALLDLQTAWAGWLEAVDENDPERAGQRVEELLRTVGARGFERLPDLSIGAALRAVRAAKDGESERAALALAAAERLDPGRPDVAFASAEVARLEGRYLGTLFDSLRGVYRLTRMPTHRELWLVNVGLYALYTLLVAGVAFVVLQVATKGGGLIRDLMKVMPTLPDYLRFPAAMVLLLWPLVLPYSLLWLILYWSLLLWGYGSTSERVVLVCVWLLAGAAPSWTAFSQAVVTQELTPPLRALGAIEEKRLYGSLFTDLGLLRSTLPSNPAVQQLLGDLHRRLGQWDLAHRLYLQVLAEEPDKPDVLINVGAYYYQRGDYTTAREKFQLAVERPSPDLAAAYFNLSQTYASQYFFDEMSQAIARAREIDDDRVTAWTRDKRGVLTTAGGFARIEEIRDLVRRRARAGPDQPSRVEALRRWLSLVLALGLVLAAAALHSARLPYGYTDPPLDLQRQAGQAERLIKGLIPGLQAVESGLGGRAFRELVLICGALLLPLMARLGYRTPSGFVGPEWLLYVPVVLVLTWWVAHRVLRALPERSASRRRRKKAEEGTDGD